MDTVPGLDLDSPPFDLLDAQSRAHLQNAVDMGFYPAGTRLIEAGKPSPHVFVLCKGHVQALDPVASGERRFADYAAGDLFGTFAVIAGRARHSYVAAEDVLCFLIPAPVFQQLLANNPRFAAYFNEGLSAKRQLAAGQQQGSELNQLMLTRVRDAQLAPLAQVAGSTSIIDASARLKADRVDCLLVLGGPAPGIVTRTDLLEALTLKGYAVDAPVSLLASRPLISVRADEVLFQALVTMTERHIERVVVQSGDHYVGSLGMAEVLAHYASTSHLISLRLARASTLEQIGQAARGMTDLVRTLHAQGAKMSYLMELVSALNRRVMAKIFDFVVPVELHPQICLLVLGSEGRREQILKTDQDNALVLADDVDWPGIDAAMEHFSATLAEVGYPPCPGKVMVSNPHWRIRQRDWQRRIAGWQADASGEGMLDLAIALDARPLAGNSELFDPVKQALHAIGRDDIALRQLARATLDFSTPLTLFGKVRGDDRGTDLKKGAVFPIVHGVRTLALRHRINHCNSFDRAQALVDAGALSAELGRDLQQSLAVFMRLRLSQQLADLDAGKPAGNFVDVRALRRLDRELLRDALRVVNTFKDHIREAFSLRE
ncbi:MAG: cyclic nucleotide-binding protein [Gammaproteobacteria bacterium HGW-Gammaproteobacteria-4]|jgi:CBS domain-containing protein|nr:MAG: cyclic nucleotide-binding protein [Gammaproteobacteria bacterium HGW-Gammaproteobacteria-4]